MGQRIYETLKDRAHLKAYKPYRVIPLSAFEWVVVAYTQM